MGSYLSIPVTEKKSEEGENEKGCKFAVTCMQGWRTSMEDAHIAALDFADGVDVFGVYDGHGGAEVALWVKLHYLNILKETPGFKAADYSQGLIESYLNVDEVLSTPEAREELQKILEEYSKQEEEAEAKREEEMAEKLKAKGGEATEEEDIEGDEELGTPVDVGALPKKLQNILAANMGIPLEALLGGDEDEDEDEAETGESEEEEDEGDDVEEEENNDETIIKSEDRPNDQDVKETKKEEEEQKTDKKDQEDAEEVKTGSVEDKKDDNDEDNEEDSESDSEFDPDEVAGGVGYDSGCTAVTCLVAKNKLYVANVGDSRCIVCRGGKAKELTKDHSPEDQVEIDRIEKAGGTIEEGRVNGNLNLTRALGDLTYKLDKDRKPEEQIITAFPDIQTHALSDEDQFMVLACDGIWNVMTSQEVIDFVLNELGKDGSDMKKICEDLCDKCLAKDTDNDGSGCDNMTFMIVQFQHSQKQPIVGEKRKAEDLL